MDRGIICSLDIKSAFDKLDRNNAINIFINKVGGYQFLFKTKIFYQDFNLDIKLDFGDAGPVSTMVGVLQSTRASGISGNIFTMNFDDILRECHEKFNDNLCVV